MSDLHPPLAGRRHLLSIGELARADVERILETARGLASSVDREVKKLPTLRGRTVVHLFYEASTRTLSSFELAAKRLSADTMSLRAAGSSVDKGESLRDTALTLAAYDPDVLVIRHPAIGAAHFVAALRRRARRERRRRKAPASDAGAPRPVHDRGRARAARGSARRDRRRRAPLARRALARPGARARRRAVDLVGPPTLVPRGIEALGCETSTDIGAIADADVVYVLRMQQERMARRGVCALAPRVQRAVRVTPERSAPGSSSCTPGL